MHTKLLNTCPSQRKGRHCLLRLHCHAIEPSLPCIQEGFQPSSHSPPEFPAPVAPQRTKHLFNQAPTPEDIPCFCSTLSVALASSYPVCVYCIFCGVHACSACITYRPMQGYAAAPVQRGWALSMRQQQRRRRRLRRSDGPSPAVRGSAG